MSGFLEQIRSLSPKQLMLLACQQHERLEAASRREPVAIIGMGCRFPGAASPDEFWRLLEAGFDAIGEVPADRWDKAGPFDADPDTPGRMAVRQGGFLADIGQFDPAFFGIAPREAQSMDPQQRLLLEVAWEALEHAGLPADRLAETATGVFVGQCNNDHFQRVLGQGRAAIDGYAASGNAPSVTSGRLAYCLGLRGPAMTVDTSCSSSLVALHLACQSLRAGETGLALAAGVNLMCAPEVTIAMSKARMLAPDGRSKAFDARADGMARGEGCGVLVLKRLADARADGNEILAVIRGIAVNQDGRSAGLTVPNGPAQEAVIAAALAEAGVAGSEIAYVEAHGTGTPLGDPIEVRALANVLGAGRAGGSKLLIGSVKTNIGHLEAAAGVAGVIKTVLCLRHAHIAPSLHFATPNPHIPWSEIAVAVAGRGQTWPGGQTRLAGVSSFGFSGTNAHVVLAEAPEQDRAPTGEETADQLTCLPLSARSAAALRALALDYAALLETGAALPEIARAACLGRSHHPWRLAVVADRAGQAAQALRAFASGEHHPALRASGSRNEDPAASPQDAAAHAYVAGGTVDWSALYGMAPGGGVNASRLPTYRFDRQRYWIEPPSRAPEGNRLFYQVRWEKRPAPPALHAVDRFMPEVTAKFQALARQHGLGIYDRLSPLLDRLSRAHVADALRALGFDDTPGRRFATEKAVSSLRVIGRQRRLFERILDMLAADGVVRASQGGWEVTSPLPAESADGLYDGIEDFGSADAPLRLLRRCAGALAAVLTGTEDPLALLFPGASLAEARALYVESPAARTYNGALAAAVLAALPAEPPGARLRVIEIGGGTGGTTETLLAALGPERVEYTFTDVSPLFLERAAARFPGLRTGLLDIERDPAGQGYEPGRYDIVVAANILHATADLAQSVRHASRLLAPGGLLLCLEAVQPERWSDLTFGMTEGWWRCADTRLRPRHPLVPVATWRAVLAEAGLTATAAIGGDAGAMAGQAQQALLVAQAARPARRFTLVGGADGLAGTLAERLQARGHDVTLREIAADATEIGDGDLVYLGALSLTADATADSCAELACAQPLRWLSAYAGGGRGRAWLVTAGAQPVTGGLGQGGRFQAPLWGIGRVFALEQPLLWGGLVDLPPEGGPGAQLDALVAALESGDDEDQSGTRDGNRHVARLARVAGPSPAAAPAIQADATYLVTGGFGGLGLLVGRWLAERGARHVALLGRNPDMGSAGVRAIQALGAQVIPLAADVADAGALRRLLDQLARTAPPVRGIVHAATDVSMAPIAALTPAQLQTMLRPKIAGLLALEQAVSGLDFAVLFSSTAALTGAAGMAHYAAANAFLDASAHQGAAGFAKQVLSVNWGRWDIVRAASAGEQAALQQGGLNPLPAAVALDAMGQLLAGGERQMMVADIDWSRLRPLYERARARPLLAEMSNDGVAAPQPGASPSLPPPPAGLPDRLLQAPPEAREALLEAFVREAVATTLAIADPQTVSLEDGLFNLGMDSLMALDLHRRLEQGIGRGLPSTLTFNHPNIRALVRYLGGLLDFTPAAAAPPDRVADSDLDALSEADIEQRLRARLRAVG
jgi:acyl transferase domain-containing protein/acyl carrier protein